MYAEPVWKVAVYTTAAPLYLIERDNYVDGGVLANNPSMQAIARIQVRYMYSLLLLSISDLKTCMYI